VETRLDGDRVLGVSDDGGRQRLSSAFVRATVDINERLTFTAGTRADRWHSESQNTPFARTVGAISPRVSLLYRLGSSGLAVRGSLYRAFRAPTLNELYRGFRVGNNVTVPNEALEPERLRAGEAGVLLDRGRASARVTGFVNVLDNTITNATVSTSPELNVRQRANADKVQAQGVELEGGVRLPWGLSSGVSLAVIDSRFRGDTTLRSNRVPQVANYTFGLALRYTGREWNAAGHLRVTGPQFEDDVNALRLGRATVLDVTAGRPLMAGVNIFVAVENLFDALYDTGRVPARTIGLPRTTRVGVQVALP
jgi:outer membrane receptor protein involved in Fe transport